MDSGIVTWFATLPGAFATGSDLWTLIQLALIASLISFGITTFFGFSLGGVIAVKRFDTKYRITDYLSAVSGKTGICIALLVYLIICYINPNGVSGLLENPTLLVAIQVVFVMPAVIIGVQKTIEKEWRVFKPQLRFWRMNAQQALPTLFWKARGKLLCLVTVTYGRVLAELGGLALLCTSLDYLLKPQQFDSSGKSATLLLGLILLLVALPVLSFRWLQNHKLPICGK